MKTPCYTQEMKNLILFSLLISSSTFAAYTKPQLLALFSDADSVNAPANTWCFFSEPSLINEKIYLPCFDGNGNFMASWDKNLQYEEAARAEYDLLFSKATKSFGKATWYEYSEFEVTRSFEDDGRRTKEILLGGLTEGMDFNTNFLPLGDETYFYQVKSEVPRLMLWKNGESQYFFKKEVAYIFSPAIGSEGEVAFKTREVNTSETSPDKIWLYQNEKWEVILEDRDSNPNSPWMSFRHQLSVDQGKVVTVATSIQGEALILINGPEIKTIALKGIDLKNFEFFTVKMNGQHIAFRGEDLKGRKAVYAFDGNSLKQIITQGDIIQTPKGPARIHYKSQDAIFYGAPGIGDKGEILQQVTLTDPDFPSTLIGVGLIKVQK